MLAPPPEGTFDIDERTPLVKIPPKDAAPEQVPLLSHGSLPTITTTMKKGKV